MNLLCLAAAPCIDRLGEVDRIEHGRIHRLGPLTVVPGGKGLNVARCAAALGAPVSALGFLAGHTGRWIAESLPIYGVTGDFVWSPGETRSCLSIYDRSQGDLTEFYESSSEIRPEDWEAFTDLLDRALTSATIVTASGTLPEGAPEDGYTQVCRRVESRRIRFLLDTHGPSLVTALPAGPWLVKINAEEAAEATGIAIEDEVDGAALARGLIKRGAQNAVVTLGRAGAVLCSSAGEWMIGPTTAVGRYPVGSGDAFLAGLAVRLLAGDALPDAARYGAAVAAANALRPGAGVLDARDVGRLLPECRPLS